ncbi:uncharacterized protein V1518DRAFT_413856 [Limtongia smithiae]|uniref:uncharacterized protein n=1 Tax=Limtongia smithiae TaxID=1125753 RepID=UPI0034CDCA8B
MADFQRRHRHLFHARNVPPEALYPQEPELLDVDDDNVAIPAAAAAAAANKPLARRQVLTLYKTLTVTQSKKTTTETYATSTVSYASISSAVAESSSSKRTVTVTSTYTSSSAAASSATVSTSSYVPSVSAVTTLLTLTTTTPTSTYSSAQSTSTAASTGGLGTSTSGSTLSVGARAGIAIGVIAGAALIFLIAFFAIRFARRHRDNDMNEKSMPPMASTDSATNPTFPPTAHVTDSLSKAPHLSIRVSRPSSGLLPLSLLSTGRPTMRTSTGDVQVAGMMSPMPSQQYSKMPSPPASEYNNADAYTASPAPDAVVAGAAPFGSPASLSEDSRPSSFASSSSDAESIKSRDLQPTISDPFASASSAADAAAAAVSASAIVEASSSTSNVHRTILDYVPTMHDELALKEGQLVRILHEYDDGWALCVKLDRSAQGVCPRSCLSARALRPRPKRGVKQSHSATSASSNATASGGTRNFTPNLPVLNTGLANSATPKPEGLRPETPTIQVFAPDSDHAYRVA